MYFMSYPSYDNDLFYITFRKEIMETINNMFL